MRKPLITALCSLLAVTACGGSQEPADSASGGVTTVNVGVIPTVDVAPLYLAQKKGTFEKHGLELKIHEVQSGAAATAAVMSGEYQFGFAAPVPEIQAQAKGLPITVVAGAISQSDSLSQALITAPDSPISSVEDLGGKTIAVNALQGLNDLVVRGIYEKNGGDQKDLKFIALPYPDMQAALDNGQIDAAWLLEPMLSGALAAKAKVIAENPQGALAGENTSFSSYFATRSYTQQNEKTVDAFVKAMTEANDYAESHPSEVREIIPTFTAITPETAAKMALGRFTTELDEDTYKVLGDYMVEYGWIKEAPDLDTLLRRP